MQQNNFEKQDKESQLLVEKIHARLLVMMKEFHRICEENHITYYIIGGTALGARRHQGFIPWDDDIDIGIPRPDFDRFAMLGGDKFPEFLETRWYKNTENSPFQFIKLIDNRTTLKEAQYDNYVEGLYIDVFPLDGTGNDSFQEKMRRKKLFLLHILVIRKCSTIVKKNPFKRLIQMHIKMLSLDRLHECLEKNLTKFKYDECELVANFLGSYGEKEVVEKRLFGEPKLYKFEDTMFYGPELIDEYLEKIYGDYMTPQPPEDGKLYHGYLLLDFDTPFREYEAKLVDHQ